MLSTFSESYHYCILSLTNQEKDFRNENSLHQATVVQLAPHQLPEGGTAADNFFRQRIGNPAKPGERKT